MGLLHWQMLLEGSHIYFWILKDYAWASNSYYMALIFGSLTVIWNYIIMIMCIMRYDWEGAYMQIATATWLGGNYIWMIGEVTIPGSNNTVIEGNDDINTLIAMYCFITTLILIMVYFMILKPYEYIEINDEVTKYYEKEKRSKRYFTNFRQYEFVHTLCWSAKDLFWNTLLPIPWIVFFIFTFLLSIDFIYLTYSQEHWFDFAHCIAQFLWVSANFAWGLGEQFWPQYDDPISITHSDRMATREGRWWAQVLLITAYQPLFLLYFVYYPLIWFKSAAAKSSSIKKSVVELPKYIGKSDVVVVPITSNPML